MTVNRNVMEIMKEKAAIDDHYNFILSLLNNYEWDENRKAEIWSGLNNIATRKNSEKLYLGIIGEFSSGKTTLINYLLQKDFLKTHTIQGTTTLTTYIEYSETADLIIEFFDDPVLSYSRNREKLWELISHTNAIRGGFSSSEAEIGFLASTLTTDDMYVQQIKTVTVYYPSVLLRKGIVIVDTPGTDSLNENHLKITEKTIRENCDLSLVMIPSEKPLSLTLSDFLKDYIPDNLHRCLFLLTKPELLRNHREREMVVQHVCERISVNLKLNNVHVILAPALLMQEEEGMVEKSGLLTNMDEDEKIRMAEDFRIALASLFNKLEEGKWVILSEKMVILMDTLFLSLTIDLINFENEYKKENEILQKNKTADLEDFIKQKKAENRDNARANQEIVLSKVYGVIAAEQIKIVGFIKSDLDKAASREEILVFLDKNTTDRMLDASFFRIRKVFNKSILEISNKLYKDFEQKFTSLYHNLAALEERIPEEYLNTLDFFSPLTNIQLTNDSFAQKIADSLGNEYQIEKMAYAFDKKFGTSVNEKVKDLKEGFQKLLPKIEASIRDDIEKGLNTLSKYIPGMVNFIKNYLPDTLDKLKEDILTKINQQLEKYYAGISSYFIAEIPEAINKIDSLLNRYAENYKTVYGELVQNMMAFDKIKSERLEQHRKKIEADKTSLKNRSESLREVKKIFKTI